MFNYPVIEIWKAFIEGYYEASNLGNIRSVDRIVKSRHGTPAKRKGVLCKTSTDKYGYETIVLSKDGEKVTVRVHRVIAYTFIPNPDNKPDVNHKNGIRFDNRAANLEWVTSGENVRDGISRKKAIAKYMLWLRGIHETV